MKNVCKNIYLKNYAYFFSNFFFFHFYVQIGNVHIDGWKHYNAMLYHSMLHSVSANQCFMFRYAYFEMSLCFTSSGLAPWTVQHLFLLCLATKTITALETLPIFYYASMTQQKTLTLVEYLCQIFLGTLVVFYSVSCPRTLHKPKYQSVLINLWVVLTTLELVLTQRHFGNETILMHQIEVLI